MDRAWVWCGGRVCGLVGVGDKMGWMKVWLACGGKKGMVLSACPKGALSAVKLVGWLFFAATGRGKKKGLKCFGPEAEKEGKEQKGKEEGGSSLFFFSCPTPRCGDCGAI
eukprot:TRINITY_DN10029_c0_g1_i1.p3 TRINITY_DN10029_c0_g1~~TRINITY_DN10029_c0_g1_i1.p3  ORF type:complete len:110 (-),score=8.72 TRINITY_DN10029_c0_g1_i1:561-890(-)